MIKISNVKSIFLLAEISPKKIKTKKHDNKRKMASSSSQLVRVTEI